MSDLERKVRGLFDAYGKISDDAVKDPPGDDDVATLAASFAPYVVGSSPMGVFGAANDEAFRAMLPKGFAHYRAVGGKSMAITGLEVTTLDDLHAIAHVDWDFSYTNKAGKSGHVQFRNLYFVTIAGGEPRIFAYVTPDEEAAMKAHGLV
jgi:hypothetical protein